MSVQTQRTQITLVENTRLSSYGSDPGDVELLQIKLFETVVLLILVLTTPAL